MRGNPAPGAIRAPSPIGVPGEARGFLELPRPWLRFPHLAR